MTECKTSLSVRCVALIVSDGIVLSMDLVDRDDVSENAILEELRVRFLRNEIYSSIGPIIIALNPYRNIADLYSVQNMNLYMESEHTPLGYHKHPPHVWTIAQSAFSHLKKTKACQAIVISGESGGKILLRIQSLVDVYFIQLVKRKQQRNVCSIFLP